MVPDQIQVLQLTMARVEGKLDAVIATDRDHEERIRKLEGQVTKLVTLGGAAGLVTGVLAQVVPGIGG